VEAPDGACAFAFTPVESSQLTAMVGLPRESRISQARTAQILTLMLSSGKRQ
jgi:hypothetical protein